MRGRVMMEKLHKEEGRGRWDGSDCLAALYCRAEEREEVERDRQAVWNGMELGGDGIEGGLEAYCLMLLPAALSDFMATGRWPLR